MCGIVGVMSTWLSPGEKERMKELLTVSNLRGYQGAGAIVTDNFCNVNTFKTVDTGTHLAHDPIFNERLYHTKPVQGVSTIIGHTRWPTKGAVTLEATHPHEYGDFVGVHNGTIDSINGKWIGKDESDSFELYKSFHENGVKETIEQTVGAYALVFIDMKKKTLNFLRNEKRPMYIAVIQGGGTIYWASEKGMLDFVLGRHATKFEVLNLLPNKLSVYEYPLKQRIHTSDLIDIHGKAAPVVAAGVPFRGTGWTTTRTWTPGTSTPIAEAKESGGEKSSTNSGKVTLSGGTTVTPLLPKPQSHQSRSVLHLSGADKPKMRWCDQQLTWVPEEPPLVTTDLATQTLLPKTPPTTSHGGSVNGKERKESQSTEETFRGPVLQHAGQVERSEDDDITPERDFSQGPQTIDEVMDELFNQSKTLYPGYRQTIKDNWMAEDHYIDCLKNGCLWCGDAQPDVPTNLWTDVDEFMCQACQQEEFAQDYICLQLAMTKEDLFELRKTA